MRKDFYYRIASCFKVSLPSLRDNTKLISTYCNDYALEHGVYIVPKLVEFYESLPWPGNYRQLKGHLDRKCVLAKCSKLDFDSTDELLIEQSSSIDEIVRQEKILSLNEMKIAYARKVYINNNQNFQKAATKLGITARSLRNILQDDIVRSG